MIVDRNVAESLKKDFPLVKLALEETRGEQIVVKRWYLTGLRRLGGVSVTGPVVADSLRGALQECHVFGATALMSDGGSPEVNAGSLWQEQQLGILREMWGTPCDFENGETFDFEQIRLSGSLPKVFKDLASKGEAARLLCGNPIVPYSLGRWTQELTEILFKCKLRTTCIEHTGQRACLRMVKLMSPDLVRIKAIISGFMNSTVFERVCMVLTKGHLIEFADARSAKRFDAEVVAEMQAKGDFAHLEDTDYMKNYKRLYIESERPAAVKEAFEFRKTITKKLIEATPQNTAAMGELLLSGVPEETEAAIASLCGLPAWREALIEPECGRRGIEKDCVTRWNGTYFMVLSFVETKKLRDAAVGICPEVWASMCWDDHEKQFAGKRDGLNTAIAECNTSIAKMEKTLRRQNIGEAERTRIGIELAEAEKQKARFELELAVHLESEETRAEWTRRFTLNQVWAPVVEEHTRIVKFEYVAKKQPVTTMSGILEEKIAEAEAGRAAAPHSAAAPVVEDAGDSEEDFEEEEEAAEEEQADGDRRRAGDDEEDELEAANDAVNAAVAAGGPRRATGVAFEDLPDEAPDVRKHLPPKVQKAMNPLLSKPPVYNIEKFSQRREIKMIFDPAEAEAEDDDDLINRPVCVDYSSVPGEVWTPHFEGRAELLVIVMRRVARLFIEGQGRHTYSIFRIVDWWFRLRGAFDEGLKDCPEACQAALWEMDQQEEKHAEEFRMAALAAVFHPHGYFRYIASESQLAHYID
jgi:hypothetical protein